MNSEHDPFFATGLLDDPLRGLPLPLETPQVEWKVVSSHMMPVFMERAFGDGSGKHPLHHCSRRCGWAVCADVALLLEPAADSINGVGAGTIAYGPLGGPVQEVPIAELYSLIFGLNHAMPAADGTFEYFTDCSWVQTSYEAGEAYCTSAGQMAAPLWKKLFRSVRDLFADQGHRLKITKVKAHASFASVAESPEAKFLWGGNALADRYAKLGAERHPQDEMRIEAGKVATGLVREVAMYLGRVAVWRLEQYGRPAVEKSEGDAGILLPPVRRPRHLNGHKPCLEHAGRWRCIVCLSSAECLMVLGRWPCLSDDSVHVAHCLWQAWQITFCIRCGYYSESRTRNLRKRCCPPTASRVRRLELMVEGRHPTKRFFVGKPKPLHLVGEWAALESARLPLESVHEASE